MRHLLMTVLVVLLSACASQPVTESPEPASQSSEVVQKQLELGVGYLRNGDYVRAKEKLNRAIELDPRNSMAHATFGLLFQLEGEDELAEDYFKRAVRFDSNNAQARNSYGVFLFEQKRYHEAVDQLSKASENRFYANRPAVFENLGTAYQRIGDLEGADYAYTRAIQLNPDQPRALLALAEMRFDERNYVESRGLYQRHTRVAAKSARTLWLCIRLARVFRDRNEEASCAEALEGIFPASEEYQLYRNSR